MFTGSIYFKYTPNGYVVTDAFEGDYFDKELLTWSLIKEMRVFGTFNFKPVKGQFCKRPHRLIQWKGK